MNLSRRLPTALNLAATALGYWTLAQLARIYFTPEGVAGVFWPASGWALARVILLGPTHAWAVLAGALAFSLGANKPLLFSLYSGLGAVAAVLTGHALLKLDPRFDPGLPSIRDYARLLAWGGLVACGASALIGTTGMAVLGMAPTAELGINFLRWWAGDALGVVVLTPLLLAWRQPFGPAVAATSRPGLEGGLILILTFLIGQIIFLDWYPELLSGLPRKRFLLFFLLIWAAVRLGPCVATAAAGIATVQGMLAIHPGGGFLADHPIGVRLVDGWVYSALMSIVGMSLAIYFRERKQAEDELRVAGIAFECQEGIIIFNANQRILRTNRSFSRMMGYASEEVRGLTTSFMRSDHHPSTYHDNVWRAAREHGSWADEIWLRHKDGHVFPQWLTVTAVANDQGVITHFVANHTDLTAVKQKEAEQRAREIAQRDALIREVHHRIKNSLQGITGVLHHFSRRYPQTESVMSHAISLVKSIAVLHGLQGRPDSDVTDAVRLEDLLRSIVEDVRSVWKTRITLDQPAPLPSFKIASQETVPIAMVLSELLVNAIKHGGQQSGHVGVTLSPGETSQGVCIRISNEGLLPARDSGNDPSGLTLVHAMMPRWGADLSMQQLGEHVLVQLLLTSPVVIMEQGNRDVEPQH